jgi:putative transcriptional regulator
MATKHKFKSDAFEAIHSSATALHKVGAIDKTTMKGFDEACLTAPPALKAAPSRQPAGLCPLSEHQ